MDKVAMIVRGRAIAGRRDELFGLYERHLAPRAESNDAQEIVVWVPDQHDDDAFFLFELYNDPEAMAANASADWFFAYLAEAGPLLDGEPVVSMGSPRWGKGV